MRWSDGCCLKQGGIMSKICKVEGCGKKYFAKGFCKIHYWRERRQILKTIPEQKKKRNEYNKKWENKNKSKRQGYRRKSLYGITQKEYENMFLLQSGRCAICDKCVKLLVDHDHKTGKIRGLLCIKCNSAISFLDESLEILNRALEYIKKNM